MANPELGFREKPVITQEVMVSGIFLRSTAPFSPTLGVKYRI